ncbi:hypothetical protein B0H17DRAFT_1140344 [Mycena rosella]|uniref:Uncharacterized protein n=1 Tax=Mycena rosella TaxID=1033263 RepID=A0AAD7D239_MYCRO|nr:hypothetical protein B0H17DRAFT_1140344 [Mycena rosella]
MVSRAPSPENEDSLYNDGKGLQFTVALMLPLKKHAQKNAKAKVVKKTLFIHEDSAFQHLLREAINSFKREDNLSFSFLPRNDEYHSTTIDIPGMTYTIPKSDFKDMSLTCDADYQSLIEAAKKKTIPETIKVFMTELKHEEGDDDESSNDDEGRCKLKKKKQKTFEPTEEEVEQNEFIVKLNAEWKCEDKSCKRFICFPDCTSAKHVHLTHMHLQTWAAAKQGNIINEDGTPVNLRNPPDTKMFSYQEPDNDDQAMLCNRTTQKSANKDPNITINLTLPNGLIPPNPLAPQQPAAAQPPAQPRIAPQIIYHKLVAYNVTGPHTLRHWKNSHLEEVGLNPAEVADVRDAQDRWIVGEKENEP